MNIHEIATKEDIATIADQLSQLKELIEAKPKEREVLRSGDVKQLLNISDSTLQRLRLSGKLPARKVNGTWFYRLTDVNKIL